MKKYLEDLRIDYTGKELSEVNLPAEPQLLFESWFAEAVDTKIPLANTMILSTVSPDNRPSSRIVLMKGFDEKGLVFFTDFKSRKGIELGKNNFASALFFWEPLYRQIRIEGEINKVPDKEADQYFASRPRESQIAAWVSQQSSEIKNRDHLLRREKELIKQFENKEVPRPHNWGGYRLVSYYFEFWQGRKSRLHDRIVYNLENNIWQIKRLAP